MSGGHGIKSTDMIPSPVRCPTGGRTSSLANRAHPPGATCSERHGIMSARHDTSADLPSDQGEDNSPGKSCASPAGNMSERHGIMSSNTGNQHNGGRNGRKENYCKKS